jgi:hypothetical protein
MRVRKKASRSVRRMAARPLARAELMASPKATPSRAKRNRKKKATTTSSAVTPPNRKDSAPTGAIITMYIDMLVKAERNLPRAIVLGARPVRITASHVRPSRSEATLLAARAGPTRVTTKKATEKNV